MESYLSKNMKMVDFTHGDTLVGEIFEKGALTQKNPLLIKITLCELMCRAL